MHNTKNFYRNRNMIQREKSMYSSFVKQTARSNNKSFPKVHDDISHNIKHKIDINQSLSVHQLRSNECANCAVRGVAMRLAAGH